MKIAPAAALCAISAAAWAQQPCAPRDVIIKTLKEHGEELTYQGMSRSPGGLVVIEFFVSPNGGWTFVVTRPDGTSCLAAGGTEWIEVKKPSGI